MKKRTPKGYTTEEWDRVCDAVEKLSDSITLQGPPAPYEFTKPPEYIYLTKADWGFKIGYTSHPNSRPLRVAGNCPVKLEVITVIQVEDMRKAEKELHGLFAHKRLRGEWFDLSADEVELVKGYPKSLESLPRHDSLDEDVPF